MVTVLDDKNLIYYLGMVGSIVLPFFNIPLIIRVVKRRSSEDISLIWLFGVFACLLAIEPAAWVSSDLTFKVFNTVNIVLYSAVFFVVIYFRVKIRNKRKSQKGEP